MAQYLVLLLAPRSGFFIPGADPAFYAIIGMGAVSGGDYRRADFNDIDRV